MTDKTVDAAGSPAGAGLEAPPTMDCVRAGLLAWLVPGLGHLYLGRRFKGLAFLILINGLFLSGWIMSRGEAMSLHERDGHRYAFVLQVGAGGPTALSLLWTHLPDIAGGFEAEAMEDYADARQEQWEKPEYIARLPELDTGLLFTMVAGLLNLLVVFEAATGAIGLPGYDPDAPAEAPESEESGKQESGKSESDKASETKASETEASETEDSETKEANA